jgi:hypothetical protein
VLPFLAKNSIPFGVPCAFVSRDFPSCSHDLSDTIKSDRRSLRALDGLGNPFREAWAQIAKTPNQHRTSEGAVTCTMRGRVHARCRCGTLRPHKHVSDIIEDVENGHEEIRGCVHDSIGGGASPVRILTGPVLLTIAQSKRVRMIHWISGRKPKRVHPTSDPDRI